MVMRIYVATKYYIVCATAFSMQFVGAFNLYSIVAVVGQLISFTASYSLFIGGDVEQNEERGEKRITSSGLRVNKPYFFLFLVVGVRSV